MDRKLNIVRHLYGEEDAGQLSNLIEDDDALRREYQALSEIKFHLDQRPRQRPDPSALDAIFVAAAETDRARSGRKDRPARRQSGSQHLRAAGFVSTVLVLLAAVGIVLGYYRNMGLTTSPGQASTSVAVTPEVAPAPLAAVPEEQPAADQPAEPPFVTQEFAAAQAFVSEAASPAPDVKREVAQESARATTEQRAPTPVALDLEWDESGDVRRLHRQIGLVEARSSGTSWNAILVPVDELQLPVRGGAGVRPVTQPTDWDF